jgi:hypothetical protein
MRPPTCDGRLEDDRPSGDALRTPELRMARLLGLHETG